MRRRLLILGWVIVLGLSAALPLSAVFNGVIHLGPSPFVARTVLTRPVIAIGSNVDLPRGSRAVVVTVVGHIRLHGRATDDLVALDGRVYLYRNARVDGDVLSILGGIYEAPGVRAMGRLGGALHPWSGSSAAVQRNVGAMLETSVRLGLAAGLALLLIGTCLTIVFPWQVVLIATTLRAAPAKSGAAGVLSLIIFVFLVVPLSLSVAGLAFATLLVGAASLAWLFGITAVAVVLGRLLSRRAVSLVWASAAGLVVIALGLTIPVLGAVLVTVIGLVGAGALAVALLSRSRPAFSVP